MTKLILLLILCIPAYGQQLQRVEYQTADTWKIVAFTKDEPPVMWFYQRSKKVGDDVEVWLKVVHPKPRTGKDHAPIVYTLDFTIFHCGTNRSTLEISSAYDAKGRMVKWANLSNLGLSEREAVIPGSVSEGMYEFFCP